MRKGIALDRNGYDAIMIDPYIEAWQLRDLLVRREIRPREAAEFFLARIEKLNPQIGAFMTITADRALADAAALEKPGIDPAAFALFGLPYSLKDLTWTKGIRTTYGSRNYANFVPNADAEAAARIMRAGGVLLGKTATPEFGGRPTTEGGLCPTACNPWNLDYTAGGSSGGAAASLAAGLSPIAEGTDGGGSIRGPASCCGVVGLKPSRGRITYAPMRGEAWGGFATRGPMARSVRDCALLFDVQSGPHIGDPYWAPHPPQPFATALRVRPKKLRIGAIATTALSPIHPEVAAAFERACTAFTEMGHTVEPLALDPGAMLLPVARPLISIGIGGYEVTHPEWIDPVVRVMFDAARKVSALEYLDLMMRMHNIAREIVQRLHPYDAVLTPTLTQPPVRNGTFPSAPERYLDELWTWIAFEFPWNATGQPVFSLSAGMTKDGLPIGFQIAGRPHGDYDLISLAAAFEEARPWKHLHPALAL